jgi:hypothetical protein
MRMPNEPANIRFLFFLALNAQTREAPLPDLAPAVLESAAPVSIFKNKILYLVYQGFLTFFAPWTLKT